MGGGVYVVDGGGQWWGEGKQGGVGIARAPLGGGVQRDQVSNLLTFPFSFFLSLSFFFISLNLFFLSFSRSLRCPLQLYSGSAPRLESRCL